jgi:hypothetical protein
MKFSLHARLVAPAYRKKADEIVVEYRDRSIIIDYGKKYPNARIALEVAPDTQWEISAIKEAYALSRGNFIVCLPNMWDPRIAELKGAGIPFFWGYTVSTFWELAALETLGAAEARIGAPIFFETDKLKNFGIGKRVVANVANDGYLPCVDGTNGSWIRPEDVDAYEGIFDVLEFADCKEHKEEALFRIYAEQKQWPGRVDMIISNIQTDAYNRMILPEFAEARKTCRQRCASGGACRICHRLLHLAQPDLIQEYINRDKEEENPNIEENAQ